MWLKSAFKLSAAKSVYGSVGQGQDYYKHKRLLVAGEGQ